MSQNRRGRPERYGKELIEKLMGGAREDGVTLKAYAMLNFAPCVQAESMKKAETIYRAIWASGVRNKVIDVNHYNKK